MALTQRSIVKEDCKKIIVDQGLCLNPLRDERILITGGTGFMGTWLSEMVTFLNDNYDFNTHLFLLAKRANSFKNTAPHLANRPDITLIERDIRNLTDISTEISWIIHAAASPDSRIHASDPLRTIDVIVNGTKSVLEYATRLPEIKKIVNISSGQIYGTQPWELSSIPEDYIGSLDCSALNSAYPESKRIAETICAVYRNQQRLPVVNIRPFAFIGPYQHLDRPWAINNFIHDSLLGGPIRILGDGQTVRSYMYPSDMAWWILNILVHGTAGLSYNLGSPEAITLLELAEKIANQFPNPPKIVKGILKDNLLRSSKFIPNVDLVKNNLNLKITVNLETALKRTISWNQAGKQNSSMKNCANG
jgi:nucleoside-diphosphate-sugar epimerase